MTVTFHKVTEPGSPPKSTVSIAHGQLPFPWGSKERKPVFVLAGEALTSKNLKLVDKFKAELQTAKEVSVKKVKNVSAFLFLSFFPSLVAFLACTHNM